jgi:hypothetical protein
LEGPDGPMSRRNRSFRIVLPLLLCPLSVEAADSDGQRALAVQLFEAGVRKMEEGRCSNENGLIAQCLEAREAFLKSLQLYPEGLGALRNVAQVEKSLGLWASAASHYRELAHRAVNDSRPERRLWAKWARQESERLEPLIPRLTLRVDRPPAAGSWDVSLDGKPIPEAAWNTPLEVDPGEHEVRTSQVDHAPFIHRFSLQTGQQLRVPLFEPVASTPPAPSSRVLPWTTTVVGAVTLAAGLGFGTAAVVKKAESCGESRFCDAQGLRSLRSLAQTSTVLSAGGGAVLLAGILWHVFLPKAVAPRTSFLMRGSEGLTATWELRF